LLTRWPRIVVGSIAAMRTCTTQLLQPGPAGLYDCCAPIPSRRQGSRRVDRQRLVV
jgi:hypothetical protein